MKKSIALLLILVLCLSLAACGTGKGSSSASTATASNPSAAASVAPAASASAAAPVSSAPGTLKIGVLSNLTGWFANIDIENVNEIKVYTQMINDAGGLKIGDKTYNITLDVQDGQSDTTGIRNAAQILADHGVKYVLEPNDFWVEGALDIFEKAGIVNIQDQNNMDLKALGANLKYAYTFCNGTASTYSNCIQALVKNYPQVKSLVYCQNDDGNNAAGEALIKSLCEKYGLTYVDKPVVYDPAATDLNATALQVISTGADAFIGNGSPNNIAAILKEIRATGSQMVCVAVGTYSSGVLMAIAGADAANNAFTMGPDISAQANNTDLFWKIFQKDSDTYGKDAAANFMGNGANNLYVLKQLMEGAKSIDVKDVQAYYNTLTTVDTIYGTGTIGGMQIYGCNHYIAMPDPNSMLVNGKIVFGGWFKTEVK